MSVQLIVYPQNYEGQFNAYSSTQSEFLSNGIFFTGLNASPLFSSASNNVSLDIINSAPASISNTWYRFRATGAGTSPTPTVSSGNLVLSSSAAASVSFSGIYQRISQLSAGQQYTVTANLASLPSPANGFIYFNVFDGTTSLGFQLVPVASLSATYVFTATSSSLTFQVGYYNLSTTNTVTISNIMVRDDGLTPSFSDFELEDGQVICDLYEDEDIPLSLSVDNFKNVAEKVQSYSKAFKLPATKRNNRIFDNMFELTRTDDGVIFNPYNKTQCVLKQDGFILFEGYLKMIDISDKDGEISYNVNLYSEVVALADVLKDRTFSELDFSELEHLYNYTVIKSSWDNALTLTNALPAGTYAGTAGASTTGVLKYPFVDWNHQYTQDANGPVLSNLESSFRPFIQLRYLINRIFAETPFTWESAFFDSAEFQELYMDFNWGSDDTPNEFTDSGTAFYGVGDTDNYATTSFTNVEFASNSFPDEMGFDGTDTFTVPAGQQNSTFNLYASIRVRNVLNNATIQFRWLKNTSTVLNLSPVYSLTGVASANFTTNSSGGISNVNIVDGGNYSSAPTITIDSFGVFPGTGFAATANGTFPGAITSVTITSPGSGYSVATSNLLINGVSQDASKVTYAALINEEMNPGDTLKVQFIASANSCIKQDNVQTGVFASSSLSTISGNVTILGVTSSVILQALRGEIGQWDFIKGIMTMFNLVSLPDEDNPNNITFEPYADIFHVDTSSGSTSDLTLASRSIQHDWTDKIDVSEMKLTPLTDLNKNTIFKFAEDDDDYSFNVYKQSVGGFLYGSKVFDASLGSNGVATVLQGTDEIVADPFAATIIKPLEFEFTDFITPAIYAYNADDGTSEGFDNSPRILFNNGKKSLTSCTFNVPAQNNVGASTTESEFLQFSHLTTVPTNPTSSDFHFGECQLIQPTGAAVANNLYNLYWSPYYNELYNADTRIMSIKVNLNSADINRFKFSDTVILKNREFRVNKIDYKPGDLATVEFILIP